MPCRFLLDSLSTPVYGSIIKNILSFPETILYLKANKIKKKEHNFNYVLQCYIYDIAGVAENKVSTFLE